MTWELKRIPLGPVAKVGFLVYFAVTLAMFLIYAIFLGGMMEMVSGMVGENMGMPTLTGGALILGGFFIAIFLSILYTLLTLLGVLIYNGITSFAGGLEFELQERYPTSVTHPPLPAREAVPGQQPDMPLGGSEGENK